MKLEPGSEVVFSQRITKRRICLAIFTALVGFMIVVAIVWLVCSRTARFLPVFPDVRGLSYHGDGQHLYVATSAGIYVFADNAWYMSDMPRDDYRGFSGIYSGFFSSGYRRSDENNVSPLGLLRSTDGGANLTSIAFEDEIAFEKLAAGYRSYMLYTFMSEDGLELFNGLHYSLDEGANWKQSQSNGLTASPIQLAVHPYEAYQVAAATSEGLFLSTDYGNTFERISSEIAVTSITFDPEMGDSLYFGTKQLYRYVLESRQIEMLAVPTLDEDEHLVYLAVNPTYNNDIAIVTSGWRVFLTPDAGRTWQQIG